MLGVGNMAGRGLVGFGKYMQCQVSLKEEVRVWLSGRRGINRVPIYVV